MAPEVTSVGSARRAHRSVARRRYRGDVARSLRPEAERHNRRIRVPARRSDHRRIVGFRRGLDRVGSRHRHVQTQPPLPPADWHVHHRRSEELGRPVQASAHIAHCEPPLRKSGCRTLELLARQQDLEKLYTFSRSYSPIGPGEAFSKQLRAAWRMSSGFARWSCTTVAATRCTVRARTISKVLKISCATPRGTVPRIPITRERE